MTKYTHPKFIDKNINNTSQHSYEVKDIPRISEIILQNMLS